MGSVALRGSEGQGDQGSLPSGRRRASSADPVRGRASSAVTDEWRRKPSCMLAWGLCFPPTILFAGLILTTRLMRKATSKPWARGIVERFGDTYMEISPSGAGLKIWVRGSVPANLAGVRVGDGQIEIYDHARYFAVTGRVFRGAPLEIEDHAADVRDLYDHLTGAKKRRWKLEPLSGGRIPYGQQHSTLVSIAGTLRARRVCDEAIEACLQIDEHTAVRATWATGTHRPNRPEFTAVGSNGMSAEPGLARTGWPDSGHRLRWQNESSPVDWRLDETNSSRIKRESRPVFKTLWWRLNALQNGKASCTSTKARLQVVAKARAAMGFARQFHFPGATKTTFAPRRGCSSRASWSPRKSPGRLSRPSPEISLSSDPRLLERAGVGQNTAHRRLADAVSQRGPLGLRMARSARSG